MKKGKELTKKELEFCISQGWGENKSSAYLDVGPATYRRWMKTYGLKSIHTSFDNSKFYDIMKLCEECGKYKCWKDVVCSRCKNLAQTRALKQFLLNKIGGKCLDCEETDYDLLEFHHTDPTKKDFTIAQGRIRISQITNYLLEIQKCIPLCNNCHKKRHTKQFSHSRLVQHFNNYLEKLQCQHL